MNQREKIELCMWYFNGALDNDDNERRSRAQRREIIQ